MRKLLRVRRLVVGGTVWLWTVRQRIDRASYDNCSTTLSLRREGSKARHLIVFRPRPGHITANTYFESGTVGRVPDHLWLNLYEPGVVHRLLAAAIARGWVTETPGTTEADGWILFDAVTSDSAFDRDVTPPKAS